MHSKPLRQHLELILDSMGMEGPVIRRAVAQRAYEEAPSDYWALADRKNADIAYLQSEVTKLMNEPASPAVVQQILDSGIVPENLRDTVMGLPRFICISSRGGAGAEHVMSWLATRGQWENNFRLKDFVTERARISRDGARDIRDLLKATRAENLLALTRRAA